MAIRRQQDQIATRPSPLIQMGTRKLDTS